MKHSISIFAIVLFASALFFGFSNSNNDPRGRYNADPNFRLPHTGYPSDYSRADKYVDNLDGTNTVAGLEARGYKTYRNGTGAPGTSAIWYQGDPVSIGIDAFNGPPEGFVGADYNAVSSGNIDNWLVSPKISMLSGDSLSFYAVSYNSDAYPDSIRVMYNAAGDSTPSAVTWVELGRFRILESVANSETWAKHTYIIPAPSIGPGGRFAIRYCTVDGGPSGANCSTIGIDFIKVAGTVSGVTQLSSEVPQSYSVSQNYPNPFNPSTKINFALPKQGNVALKVYNNLGKEVASLVNGFKTAGVYEVNFDASSLSSGIYFYTIQSEGFTQTKRMMLIK